MFLLHINLNALIWRIEVAHDTAVADYSVSLLWFVGLALNAERYIELDAVPSLCMPPQSALLSVYGLDH